MISKSPERNTFQKEAYLERCKQDGKEPSKAYLEMFEKFLETDDAREVDPEWQKDNLEYDLRTSDWMLEKVRNSKTYAQNLYAAMCNMQFQKLEVLPILKDERWSCSWRHSGGIISDMRQEGDYIDWYCSGIRNDGDEDNGSVPEGTVTNEIKADLAKLGWVAVEWKDE